MNFEVQLFIWNETHHDDTLEFNVSLARVASKENPIEGAQLFNQYSSTEKHVFELYSLFVEIFIMQMCSIIYCFLLRDVCQRLTVFTN